MFFHGHEIDVERAYHEISLEFAKRTLSEYLESPILKGRKPAPQATLDLLSESYFNAYGYLCRQSEDTVSSSLEQHYNAD
ncbi:MAG: hypothetical protein E7572_03990 [Ruminococcaceae bacterium]|nr:hypothetical protein [Oscillospiraceae bacterium]